MTVYVLEGGADDTLLGIFSSADAAKHAAELLVGDRWQWDEEWKRRDRVAHLPGVRTVESEAWVRQGHVGFYKDWLTVTAYELDKLDSASEFYR